MSLLLTPSHGLVILWALFYVLIIVLLPFSSSFSTLPTSNRHTTGTAYTNRKSHPTPRSVPHAFARSRNTNKRILGVRPNRQMKATRLEDHQTNHRYEMSTLTLLEHINLNVPNHYDYCLDFYVGVLGCGLDPRKAMNAQTKQQQLQQQSSNKTLWVNMGASQIHLPYDSVAQRIPGRIGLRVRRWEEFEQRVIAHSAADAVVDDGAPANQRVYCIQRVERQEEDTPSSRHKRPTKWIQLTDRYDNVFYCRPHEEDEQENIINDEDEDDEKRSVLVRPRHAWRQPIVTHSVEDVEQWGDIAREYGRPLAIDKSNDESTPPRAAVETECSGVDFVEFYCPRGTAARIALFYDSVLDATVSVLNDDDDDSSNDATVAIIAIGQVDTVTGRADQALIFRETDQPIPPYDGHHIALYVGASAADFDQAYRNCEIAGVVWVNPRFSDQATTLPLARQVQQFRFKNIVDMETGVTIFELEHELRSIDHEAWPGRKR